MPRPTVALDADVLVPILACDFVLTAFDLGLYEPVVSIRVLDEVERTLVRTRPQLRPPAAEYRVDAMRTALEDHLIDAADTEVPQAINSKDRHLVGAALLGQATILASNDNRLRGEVAAALPGLWPMNLDELATHLFQQSPDDVSSVVDHLVAKRTRPPVTREGILAALENIMPVAVYALRQAKPG